MHPLILHNSPHNHLTAATKPLPLSEYTFWSLPLLVLNRLKLLIIPSVINFDHSKTQGAWLWSDYMQTAGCRCFPFFSWNWSCMKLHRHSPDPWLGRELNWWCVQLAGFLVVVFERLQPETFYIQNNHKLPSLLNVSGEVSSNHVWCRSWWGPLSHVMSTHAWASCINFSDDTAFGGW